jgi:hypothetical protein
MVTEFAEKKSYRKKEPKLTKSGKPRKPHVMTPARTAAFEKCRLARAEKMTQKKSFVQESVNETQDPVPAASE